MSVSLERNPTPPTHKEPGIPSPPRYRWLKRGAICIALGLMTLGGLRAWWEHVAQLRYGAMVDHLHARGEPILPEDFAPGPIPDGDNAADTLQAAAGAMVRDSNYAAFDTNWLGDPLTPTEVRQLGAIVALNQGPLALARRARSQRGVDWKCPVNVPPFGWPLPHLNSQRELANLQRYAGMHDHATGDDAEAIERVEDILRQSRAVDADPPLIITHLVAMGIRSSAIALIEWVTPDLQVDLGTPKVGSRAANRAQVLTLIQELLDDDAFCRSSVRAYQGERMWAVASMQSYAAGNASAFGLLPGGKPIWLVKPMVELESLRIADRYATCIAALKAPDYPSASAALPATASDHEAHLQSVSGIVSRIMGTNYKRFVFLEFRAATDRRAAAIHLAVRLYQVDHGGHLPATLDELVPAYLPRVPNDPMAAGSRLMQYRPAANPPVIYSVGENGTDEGGSIATLVAGHDRWRGADAVYPLGPLPPTTQPSPQAQDHQ